MGELTFEGMSAVFAASENGEYKPIGKVRDIETREADELKKVNTRALDSLAAAFERCSFEFNVTARVMRDMYVAFRIKSNNKTVNHLAYHARKERTRKKNYNRMLKIIKRANKWN